MQILHYLNQFFAGLGGEEKASVPLEVHDGPLGPGRLFEEILGSDARVVKTFVCGDNYAVEHQDEIVGSILRAVQEMRPELFVAGPCFQAGRYGMASGALCAAVQSKLGVPVITGMAEENPGADLYREALYIIDSGSNAAKMRDILMKMAGLGKKLVKNEEIGLPGEEGYLRRGLIRDEFVEKTAAVRLVDMLLAKARGKPFESEMVSISFEPIPMPSAIKDLSKATVMLITDGGLVPKGNPDKIQGMAATNWGVYSIHGVSSLKREDYEISHGGYDPRFVQADPNRLVPLDVMREMERNGVIGKLHHEFFSTSGLSNPLFNTRRIGKEMAERIRKDGVDAVILTST